MSRFGNDGNEWDDEYLNLSYGRWEHNLRTAIAGKKGQKALRDLRPAPLALPDRRLISGELATPGGEVCTVGCLVALHRAKQDGVDITEAAKRLFLEDPLEGDYEEYTTAQGKKAGLVYTLAWQLGYMNDETWRAKTPEQRWQACIEWVESQIVEPA